MSLSPLIKFIGVFISAYLILLSLSLTFKIAYITIALPLYHWELGYFSHDLQLQGLELGTNHGEAIITATFLSQYFVLGQQVVPPGISISSSTLIGYALQHPLLMLSLTTAWPALTRTHKILSLMCVLPFLIGVELLDIPLVLLGSAQDILVANLSPDSPTFCVKVSQILNNGGRSALSIFAALLSIALSKYLYRHLISGPK